MRKNRVVEQNRCYHLVSRLAHRAFFLDDEEKDRAVALMRRIRVLYRDASLSQVVATWNRLKTEEQELLKRARPAKKYVSRFEAYKSSFVRRSRIHFSRYYMTPLIEKGLVARTDPENPMSPRQEYKLT